MLRSVATRWLLHMTSHPEAMFFMEFAGYCLAVHALYGFERLLSARYEAVSQPVIRTGLSLFWRLGTCTLHWHGFFSDGLCTVFLLEMVSFYCIW